MKQWKHRPQNEYSCVSCGKTIKKLEPGLGDSGDDTCMWDGGLVGMVSAGYGSIHDGDIYLIAICDDCLTDKKVRIIGDYMIANGTLTEDEVLELHNETHYNK